MNKRLKELRNYLNLSQEQFGKKINLSKPTISALENATRGITDRVVHSICEQFNVSEEWLRTGAGQMFIQTDNTIITVIAKKYHLDMADQELLRIFLQLTPEQRDALKSFAFSFVHAVWDNQKLYDECRESYINKNASPYAARSGATEGLEDLIDSYDKQHDMDDVNG